MRVRHRNYRDAGARIEARRQHAKTAMLDLHHGEQLAGFTIHRRVGNFRIAPGSAKLPANDLMPFA